MSDEEQAGPGGSGASGVSAGVKAALAAAGLGALAFPLEVGCGAVLIIIFCGLGVLLLPLVILYLLFHGGLSGGAPACSGNAAITAQVVPAPPPHHGGCGVGGTAVPTAPNTDPGAAITALQGSGQGDLAPGSVPADLRAPIEKAGKLCGGIGPIVIAAQIQYLSGFNAKMVGPDGKQGISQLPPDKFKQFSQDDDNNKNVSPLDATDSIMAQGRYLCSLYGDVQQLVSSGQAQGDALSMTLAAYGVGLDAIKQAKGVPNSNAAQGYVLGVRVYFSVFQGIGTAVPSMSALPTAS